MFHIFYQAYQLNIVYNDVHKNKSQLMQLVVCSVNKEKIVKN